MAATGVNPATGSNGANRWLGGTWAKIENRLWVIERMMPFSGLCRDEALLPRLKDGLRAALPGDLVISELGKSTSGLMAHAAAVFLRPEELAVAFAMVTMKSGLNPDSLSRMTVSQWFRSDPIQPGKRVILFGPKRVGSAVARASSSISKLTDPYQIISRVIEIQAPLRARLVELATERGDMRLKELASLVWVGVGTFGVTDLLPNGNTFMEVHSFLDAYFARVGVVRKDGTPLRYRVTQGRDVWGLFVYHRSGFNHILTAQALGHSTLKSLLHYLEKRVLVIEDRKRLIDLQDRVLTDLTEGRFAPKRYREGVIETATTGLHCTDPTHPAPEADPGNSGGKPCVSQGCWACWNWFASRESLPSLLRMIMDLEHLRSTLPLALWETSDYPVKMAVYEHIVGKFHVSHVEAARPTALAMAPIVTTSMFVARNRRAEAAA